MLVSHEFHVSVAGSYCESPPSGPPPHVSQPIQIVPSGASASALTELPAMPELPVVYFVTHHCASLGSKRSNPRPVPIHITYMTAWTEGKAIQFRDDLFGREAKLAAGLRARP